MNSLDKIAFFMVRYNGFQYLDEIIKFINSTQFKFRILGVFGIKHSNDKFNSVLEKVYCHKLDDVKAMADIKDRNKNVLIGIICVDYAPKYATPDTHSDNMNTVIVKRHFREKYRNIIHVSDNEKLAYIEIGATLGFTPNDINCMLEGKVPTIGVCKSSSKLIEKFNKIEDGRKVLWQPT